MATSSIIKKEDFVKYILCRYLRHQMWWRSEKELWRVKKTSLFRRELQTYRLLITSFPHKLTPKHESTSSFSQGLVADDFVKLLPLRMQGTRQQSIQKCVLKQQQKD
jgi:hypothetical protein